MKTETTITDDHILVKITPEDATDELIRQAMKSASTAQIKHNGGVTFIIDRPKQKLSRVTREGGESNAQ